MAIEVELFMCRQDNFGALIRDSKTGAVAMIDAPEEGSVVAAIERTGWIPSRLFVTHHHSDHVAANLALKEHFKLRITGPEAELDKIPGIDEVVKDGSRISFGSGVIEVIATPGHTAGHVCYYLPQAKTVFTADTLFALGCGRLFERPPEVMFKSLQKLAALPADTQVYCGHEYTLNNAHFALTIDPGNAALQARVKEVEALRAQGRPTLPTTIGAELETNPFLRFADPAIRKKLGMENATDVEVFAEIRRRKDNA